MLNIIFLGCKNMFLPFFYLMRSVTYKCIQNLQVAITVNKPNMTCSCIQNSIINFKIDIWPVK